MASALHSDVPQYRARPDSMISCIAHTVSSMGVSGSGRWQKIRSMKSSRRRFSDPSIACSKYLRFSVFRVLTESSMPQKYLLDMRYVWRGHLSSAMAAHMMLCDSPPAYTSALSKKWKPESYAAASTSRALVPASWGPKLTQEPKEKTLTRTPARPRWR